MKKPKNAIAEQGLPVDYDALVKPWFSAILWVYCARSNAATTNKNNIRWLMSGRRLETFDSQERDVS
jgi:hypothetical protein